MITKYFNSINSSLLEGTSGLYALYFGKEEWFCCSYKNKDVYKKNIVNLTNQILNIKTIESDWEFHHIIERQHLADIPLKELGLATLGSYYADEIPTIIINKSEHKMLSSYFHFKQFRDLYTTHQPFTISGNAANRQNSSNSNLSRGIVTRDEIVVIIDRLIDMYNNAYVDHPMFQIISFNFFTNLKQQIRI